MACTSFGSICNHFDPIICRAAVTASVAAVPVNRLINGCPEITAHHPSAAPINQETIIISLVIAANPAGVAKQRKRLMGGTLKTGSEALAQPIIRQMKLLGPLSVVACQIEVSQYRRSPQVLCACAFVCLFVCAS